jgi:Na+-driven multidrug efflux pump
MKRVLAFFFIVVLTLFVAPVIMAQVIDPPASVIDLLANLNLYLGSMIGVAAMATFLGALLNGLLKVTKTFIKQLVVWIVAIVVLVVANLVNIGYAAEFTIWQSLLHGLGAGLVANGIFDIPVVKAIMEFIERLFDKPVTE